MARAYGRATITVGGITLDSKGDAKINTGGIKREKLETDHGVHFTEKLTAAEVECEVAVTTGFSVTSLQSAADVVVTVQLDSGQTYVIRGGFVEEASEISKGCVKVKISGPPAEEM